MAHQHNHDVVIVGGGIAGSALATVLARDGLEVLLLERQTSYRDKVRGEVLLCWGVAELLRLDLEQPLLQAGGSYVTRYVSYDEFWDPQTAEANALPLGQLLPDVPGALDVGHPQACQALWDAAAAAGATTIRGIGDVEISTGDTTGCNAPTVRYEHNNTLHQVTCRLIIGADGRMSSVRRQLGIELAHSTPRTMMGGLLVDDLHAWPADQFSLGTEGDLHFLIFPRAQGRARLYLMHDIAQTHRFSGSDATTAFLEAFRFHSIPAPDMTAQARPAGPCAFYPMNDSWTDDPCAPGVVLIGDAAGWNDPLIGQGLSIALRDARLVADTLRTTSDWNPTSFAGYVEERRERMRRLRISAQVATELRATFTPTGIARRRTHTELLPTDPILGGSILAGLIGPENVPGEAFERPTIDRIHALT